MNLTDCRFCSEVSKNNGEDPIGTAGTYEHWLILELKQPWSPTIWVDDPRVTSLVALMKKLILWRGFNIRVLAIAPDLEYSITGYARLFYYRRPSRFFSEFNKQEFLVPESNLVSLATALLKNDTKILNNFEQYRQDTNQIRDILVCTHANVDVACGRFGYPIYKQLRSKYAAHSNGQLRVWRCSHFGGHQFAPTFIDLPQGHYWGHVEPERLDLIIHRTGSVSELRQFYRGWSGLKPLEQIVEREIWIKEGWDWLKYSKSGRIISIEGKGLTKYLYQNLQFIPIEPLQILLDRWAKKNISQATIRIEFKTADHQIKGAYEAIVETIEPVMSAYHSATQMQLTSIKQYRVSNLSKKIN